MILLTMLTIIKVWAILIVLFCTPLFLFPKTEERIAQEIEEEDEIERIIQAYRTPLQS